MIRAALLSSLLAIGCAPAVELHPIAPGVWLHVTRYEGYPGNGLVIEGEHGSILVDTGASARDAERLLRIERRRGRPVRAAVVTHAHPDRIGGAAALERAGAHVYAAPATIAHARARRQPLPDTPIADGQRIDVDGAQVIAVFPGAGHSDDNIAIWVPAARVLFGGCLVKSAAARDLGNVADADLTSWPRAIERLQAQFPAAEIVVPGHGPLGGDPLARTLELLRQRGAITTAVP